jgi:hypothetical protein
MSQDLCRALTAKARLLRAKQIVKSDLNSYDLLSRPPKIRREPESRHYDDTSSQYGPERGYVCGHHVSLCSPCDSCKRSGSDCTEYQVALQSKLKELLSQLNR